MNKDGDWRCCLILDNPPPLGPRGTPIHCYNKAPPILHLMQLYGRCGGEAHTSDYQGQWTGQRLFRVGIPFKTDAAKFIEINIYYK